MAQEQQKMSMQVKTKTVTDADLYSAQEQSAPETNSVEAQTRSSWALRWREPGGFGDGLPSAFQHVLKNAVFTNCKSHDKWPGMEPAGDTKSQSKDISGHNAA